MYMYEYICYNVFWVFLLYINGFFLKIILYYCNNLEIWKYMWVVLRLDFFDL